MKSLKDRIIEFNKDITMKNTSRLKGGSSSKNSCKDLAFRDEVPPFVTNFPHLFWSLTKFRGVFPRKQVAH